MPPSYYTAMRPCIYLDVGRSRFRPLDLVEGGAIEAALSVLEHADITTPRGSNTSALYVAASSLITETTEASSSRPQSAQSIQMWASPVSDPSFEDLSSSAGGHPTQDRYRLNATTPVLDLSWSSTCAPAAAYFR
jgi:hypothetical protein